MSLIIVGMTIIIIVEFIAHEYFKRYIVGINTDLGNELKTAVADTAYWYAIAQDWIGYANKLEQKLELLEHPPTPIKDSGVATWNMFGDVSPVGYDEQGYIVPIQSDVPAKDNKPNVSVAPLKSENNKSKEYAGTTPLSEIGMSEGIKLMRKMLGRDDVDKSEYLRLRKYATINEAVKELT